MPLDRVPGSRLDACGDHLDGRCRLSCFPPFVDQFADALPELRWVRPTALRHRGCSFPPQPWGLPRTRGVNSSGADFGRVRLCGRGPPGTAVGLRAAKEVRQ